MNYKYNPNQNSQAQKREVRQPAKKGKSVGKTVFWILVIALVGSFIFGYSQYSAYEKSLTTRNSESATEIDFFIEEGDTTDEIVNALIEVGLLREDYKTYFKIYLRQSGEASKFQAGSFRIPMNLTMKELAITLQTAGVPDLWVTIPEGLRKDEIANILAEAFATREGSVFNEDEFLALTENEEFIANSGLNLQTDNLEGFIFPDRYLLPVESTTELVLTTLIENYKTKDQSGYTYEEVIIASMLEREGNGVEEYGMISDIIARRLEEGWYLGIDATLLYYFGDWNYELTIWDLEDTDNPYNTRAILGLPPTPISNPGQDALEAAHNPTPNNYYYYMHDSDGIIHYAKTLSEHNNNIAKY